MRPVRSSQHRGICLHPGRQRSPARQPFAFVPSFSVSILFRVSPYPRGIALGYSPTRWCGHCLPFRCAMMESPWDPHLRARTSILRRFGRGPYSYYPKTNIIVSHRRWACDCVRDNFFKIWKFFPGRRLRRGIRLMRRKQPCPCRGRPGAFPAKEPPGWNGMEKRKRGAAAASAEGKRKPGPWKRCRQKEAADEKKRNRKRIKKRQDLRNKVFLIENNSARILFCREAPATPASGCSRGSGMGAAHGR